MQDWDQFKYEDEAKNNNLDCGKPIIAFCPDWRHDAQGNPGYIRALYNFFKKLIDEHGCHMHLMKFDDKVDDIKDKIHGWLIPGGRDIDPKFYGQENTHSKVEAADSEKRWLFCKNLLENSNPKMPILGICYGFQVLNCLFGGDMIQDLEHGQKNHYRKNKLVVEPGTRLEAALQGAQLVGQCYHHQGLGKIPACLKLSAWDEEDKYPHALEYNGDERNIIAVLWHPESTYKDTRREGLDKANLLIFGYFFDQCRNYKASLAVKSS